MTLSDIKDRLTKLETDKLIDISKNYKQYGYDNETRNYVLNLLKERNVSIEDLRLTGNIGNNNYEQAVQLFDTFKRNSTSAFFFYLMILLFKLSIVVHFSGWTSSPAFYSVLFYAAIAGYLFFLIKSFFNQSDMYKMAGDDYGTEGAVTYLFGGVAFYFVTYFYFLKQMKEKMKSIK